MEIWKGIKGFDNYQVSNLGRIRGLSRTVKCFGGTKVIKERICKPTMGTSYMLIKLGRGTYLLHRIIAEAFIPNPENKKQVNHINGNKLDNRIENLEWATPAENNLHAFRTGLKSMVGVRHTQSKLNEHSVRQIRLLRNIHTQTELAKMFLVSRATISAIHTSRSWSHIK